MAKLIYLNIGCGDLIYKSDKNKVWFNCDLYSEFADTKCDAKDLKFNDNTVDYIYNSHNLEHFNFKEAFDVLKEWKRVLKVGGKLMVETPDMLSSCKKFVEASEQERIGLLAHFFSEPWIDGQWHKFLYTEAQLFWTLEKCGFRNIKRVPAKRYINKEDICLGMECTK
jgi:predicted SAM-dependent methyltransferase